MSDLISELTYLQETKNQIKNAILGKGGSIAENAPFTNYSSSIGNLPGPKEWSELEWQTTYSNAFASISSTTMPEIRVIG